MRLMRDRHADHSDSKARQAANAVRNKISRRSAATLNGKFESQSNEHDE
jgi:hypothetical protein